MDRCLEALALILRLTAMLLAMHCLASAIQKNITDDGFSNGTDSQETPVVSKTPSTPPPRDSDKNKAAIIVGASIGTALAILALIAVAVFGRKGVIERRRPRNEAYEMEQVGSVSFNFNFRFSSKAVEVSVFSFLQTKMEALSCSAGLTFSKWRIHFISF